MQDQILQTDVGNKKYSKRSRNRLAEKKTKLSETNMKTVKDVHMETKKVVVKEEYGHALSMLAVTEARGFSTTSTARYMSIFDPF